MITIIGCGLNGSLLIYPLFSHEMSIGKRTPLTLVDHDDLEKRNSPSNHNVELNTGKKKVYLLASEAKDRGYEVRAVASRLNRENAEQVIGETDLIVGAVDNPDARIAMWHYAELNDVPYIDIGINDYSFYVGWKYGIVDSMQFSLRTGSGSKYKLPSGKSPPCTLVGSRVIAAIAAELAAKSISIFMHGHDPWQITGQENPDCGIMVSWIGQAADNGISIESNTLGGKNGLIANN